MRRLLLERDKVVFWIQEALLAACWVPENQLFTSANYDCASQLTDLRSASETRITASPADLGKYDWSQSCRAVDLC